MHAPSKRIFLAAVLAIAAATAVSAVTEIEVAKAANAVSRVDLSAVSANLVANVKQLKRHFHVTRGSSHGSLIRGRSLAQVAMCDYDDHERSCEPGKGAFENFKPETPEGQVREGRAAFTSKNFFFLLFFSPSVQLFNFFL